MTTKTPELKRVLARDVLPYHWGVWCTVGGRPEPFSNTIEHVSWSEDGQHLWFMLGTHNFCKAAPDQEIELVPHELAEWHDLEARWKAILGLEAAVDTLRKSVEGLRAELEASMRRALTADEKVHALAADMVQWAKAKSRAHFALPKASEFIQPRGFKLLGRGIALGVGVEGEEPGIFGRRAELHGRCTRA